MRKIIQYFIDIKTLLTEIKNELRKSNERYEIEIVFNLFQGKNIENLDIPY